MSKRVWASMACGLLLCGAMAVVPIVLAGPVKAPAGMKAEAPVAQPPQFRIPGRGFAPRKVMLAASVTGGDQQDWGLGPNGVRVASAWAVTKGKGVKVAILDTGVDGNHPDLKDQVIEHKDFTNSLTGTADIKGHGTHCAGIVAMKADGQGYLGVAPECKILSGKIMNDQGAGDFEWAAQGVLWAIEKKADVISMSMGGFDGVTPPNQFVPNLRAAIKKAVDAGIIVVVAAGNERGWPNYRQPPCVTYPGRYEEVITVAASTINRQIEVSFSGAGPEVDVAAPGDNIMSTLPNGQYGVEDGTSMATPMVAGVAALYVAAKRDRAEVPSQADFRKLIETTSFTQATQRPNWYSGWGLIQADKIIAEVTGSPAVAPVEFVEGDFVPAAWGKLKDKVPAIKGLSLEFNGENVKATIKK